MKAASQNDPRPKPVEEDNKPLTNEPTAITNAEGEESEDELFHEQAGENATGYEGEKEKDGTLPGTEKGRVTNSGEEHGMDDMLNGEKEEDEEL